MRWVLIKPRNRSPYYDPEIQEPLGLECLSASLRLRDDAVLILDLALEGVDERRAARRAAGFELDAVGFSVTTFQDLESLRQVDHELRRALGPRPCRFVAGGNFVSTEPRQAERLLPDDYLLVRFEGETALAELSTRDGLGMPPSGSRIVVAPVVADLDTLPFPDRPYAAEILGSGWAFNVQASRGCWGACRYCASPGMRRDSHGRWRGRSPAHIVEEIDQLQRRFGAQAFNFVDEDFLGPPRLAIGRARAFASEVRRRGLRLCFSIQVRPDSLSETAIDALIEAGLTYVFMGLESDQPEDFRRWGRPWTENPWRFVTRLRDRGAMVNVGVLLFHPDATLEGIRHFGEALYRFGLLEYQSARNRLDAMPGSALHAEALVPGCPVEPGPMHLPFADPRVDAFYQDLITALEPLGPPSMHALCALPPLLTAQRLDGRLAARCAALQRVVAELDEGVARTFFALLESHERGCAGPALVAEWRQRSLERGLRGARALVDAGVAPSLEALREAIRIDAGT